VQSEEILLFRNIIPAESEQGEKKLPGRYFSASIRKRRDWEQWL
jgi:hypothetical protein